VGTDRTRHPSRPATLPARLTACVDHLATAAGVESLSALAVTVLSGGVVRARVEP